MYILKLLIFYIFQIVEDLYHYGIEIIKESFSQIILQN